MISHYGCRVFDFTLSFFKILKTNQNKISLPFSQSSVVSRNFSATTCVFKHPYHNKNEVEPFPVHIQKRLKIGVQGAPFDRGQPKPGVEKGPAVIRNSGFMNVLREIGHDVKDYGDIEFNLPSRSRGESVGTKLKNLKEVAAANRLISLNTKKILKDEGRICLTLGGDHSIGLGTVHGASEVYNDLAVLWVDAHSDINTADTTTSGNMHGMPLAFVVKELQSFMPPIPEFSWVTPRISASNVAYIGLRSVDDGEREIIKKLGITAFSMHDVDQLGILEVVKRALDSISPSFNKRPLHVSFDIDALDDLEVSNTGTPVSGGLSVREGVTIMEEVNRAGNMVSMDLVEVNPDLGDSAAEERTGGISKHILTNAFGYFRRGISNYPLEQGVKSRVDDEPLKKDTMFGRM